MKLPGSQNGELPSMYLKEKETIPVRVSYKRETFLTSAKERREII